MDELQPNHMLFGTQTDKN